MPTCGIVTFRLGQHDGVSSVTFIWQEILEQLGFDTTTVAGDGIADQLVPGLSIGAENPPDKEQLRAALAPFDYVILENIGTIPLNLPASLMLLELLGDTPTIFHHHDPPWQRAYFGHIRELPANNELWEHVVINDLTQRQMEHLGFAATRIYNPVRAAPPSANRAQVRELLGVEADDLLLVHPTRAMRLKNIPAALAIAEKLGGTYWLVGPPEDGYGPLLAAQLNDACCRVIQHSNRDFENPQSDMYAAADLLVYPSFWESFGIPPMEAALHQVPAVVGDYPIAEEQRGLGFKWFYPWELKRWQEASAEEVAKMLATNQELAEQYFSVETIAKEISSFLKKIKWL